MPSLDAIQPAIDALDACNGAVAVLDMNCCDPGRSPRIAELSETLAEARVKVRAVTVDPAGDGSAAIEILESAGAQVGRLQVGCCAPDRMPLYTEILENLTKAQMVVGQVVRKAG